MLADKVALVTGGTGAIGAAVCRILAREGAAVAFTYHRQEARAQALREELAASGRPVFCAAVEATDADAIGSLVKEVEQHLGGIQVLVNNLGAIQVLPFALIEAEDWYEIISVNLKSMFLFTRAVVRGMIRRRAGPSSTSAPSPAAAWWRWTWCCPRRRTGSGR